MEHMRRRDQGMPSHRSAARGRGHTVIRSRRWSLRRRAHLLFPQPDNKAPAGHFVTAILISVLLWTAIFFAVGLL